MCVCVYQECLPTFLELTPIHLASIQLSPLDWLSDSPQDPRIEWLVFDSPLTASSLSVCLRNSLSITVYCIVWCFMFPKDRNSLIIGRTSESNVVPGKLLAKNEAVLNYQEISLQFCIILLIYSHSSFKYFAVMYISSGEFLFCKYTCFHSHGNCYSILTHDEVIA